MGSTERTLLTNLKTNLKGIDGSGSYNNDFSADDRVIIGTTSLGVMPNAPCIYFFVVNIGSDGSGSRTAMRNYDREMTVQIDALVARSVDSTENAQLQAVDVASDVMRAVEADPTLGGLSRRVVLDVSAYDGEQAQLPGYAVATLMLTIYYSEVRGQ